MLGSPTEDTWPGISMSEELQGYNFPQYSAEPLVKRAPRLDQDGIDLVARFLLYEAKERISARDALVHPYFDSLGTSVRGIPDGNCFCYLTKKSPVMVTVTIIVIVPFAVQSIFTVPGISLSKDPGYRSSAFSHSTGKSRRQSMLL